MLRNPLRRALNIYAKTGQERLAEKLKPFFWKTKAGKLKWLQLLKKQITHAQTFVKYNKGALINGRIPGSEHVRPSIAIASVFTFLLGTGSFVSKVMDPDIKKPLVVSAVLSLFFANAYYKDLGLEYKLNYLLKRKLFLAKKNKPLPADKLNANKITIGLLEEQLDQLKEASEAATPRLNR